MIQPPMPHAEKRWHCKKMEQTLSPVALLGPIKFNSGFKLSCVRALQGHFALFGIQPQTPCSDFRIPKFIGFSFLKSRDNCFRFEIVYLDIFLKRLAKE